MDFRLFRDWAVAAIIAFGTVLFTAAPASAQVAVTVNGNQISLSPAPIVQAGRVFVPLRGVFEQLGASVVYSNGTINATGNGHNISLQIGSNQAIVDGQTQTLDVAPFIVGDSTYVPLRFVSEALGATVNWDDANNEVDIELAGAPQTESVPVSYDYATYAPPPLPVYQQPYVPEPNYIWQPGYWAWGPYGYYWVPGTWVAAPQPGYYWTPGYWSWSTGRYFWNQGYWAIAVGFYGGVNYGSGYYGNGYSGGRWSNDTFRYNTYVTRVNTAIVRNVYVDRTVYVNNPARPHPSYNGPGGVQAHPSPQQIAIAREKHFGPTPVQQQHVQAAAQDRRLLAKYNHDAPPVPAVATPLNPVHRAPGFVPVAPGDRVAPVNHPAPVPVTKQPAAPAIRATPAYHPVPAQPPAYHAPVVRATPVYHPAPAQPPAYHAPVVHATPAYHPAPAQPPAYRPPTAAPPAYRAPPARVTPAYHPPPAQAPPANHPPAQPAPANHPPQPRPPLPHPAAHPAPKAPPTDGHEQK